MYSHLFTKACHQCLRKCAWQDNHEHTHTHTHTHTPKTKVSMADHDDDVIQSYSLDVTVPLSSHNIFQHISKLKSLIPFKSYF